MATTLLYLEDFDVVNCDAEIVDTAQHDDGRTMIILNQTCFYPRGGGQDWDTGTISNNDFSFAVEEVRLDAEGTVLHIGSFERGNIEPNTKVEAQVDATHRTVNTRLHSAGHVIDMAIAELRPDWIASKGAHYPHMCAVEYAVAADEQLADDFIEALEAKIVTLQMSDYENQIRFMSREEMQHYCRHVPENMPTNKPSRIVLYADDFGIPCGGTHVRQLKDIGTITISKLKIKKGTAKISYAVSGIN